MKYLIYSSSSLAYPHFGVQLEECEKLNAQGHSVTFAYCDGINNTCFKNINSNPAICKACKLGYRFSINKLSKNIEIIPLNFTEDNLKHNFIFNSINDIKEIKYKKVSIGYAVLSTFISVSRNPEIKLDDPTRDYLNHLINQTCKLVDSVYNLIDKVNPDVICVFNGRFFETKPLFDIGISKNIEVIINEVIGSGTENDPFKITKFINSMPHDIAYLGKKVLSTWDCSKLSYEEKIIIGESFYFNKKKGLNTGLINFTSNQEKGKLPSNWDNAKKNIVIFNSSEDEFASIGKEFDSYAIFNSQIEGIKFMLSNCKLNNIHFYLRIHPNLSNVTESFHTDLLELDKLYTNITIIKGDDKISTYALIDSSWKVIVFGSTVGIESSFWGKPSILLAGSIYHDLNALYKPSSKSHLLQLIEQELTVLNTFPAIQFGFFVMNRDTGVNTSKYFDLSLKKYSLFGFEFNQPKYMAFLGSYILIKLIHLIYIKIFTRLLKDRFPFPKKNNI
jgi:hypothetical protein